jgi:hypothetical protein
LKLKTKIPSKFDYKQNIKNLSKVYWNGFKMKDS